MATKKKALQAAAGAAGAGEAVYIDDIFSTYLYTGNGSTQTITNGIDLDGEGGLVWIKGRDIAAHSMLHDTERGVTKYLMSSLTNAEGTSSTGDRLTAFNTDGFSLGTDPGSSINNSSYNYASWTFRKAPGFFDVVTGTADASGNCSFTHNLGCDPGMIIVKRLDNAVTGWLVWHKSLSSTTDDYMYLNATDPKYTASNVWAVSSTTVDVNFQFTSPAESTYVAYLFADGDDADAQIFGTDGDQAVVKCGSFTTDGSYNSSTTLGWEPQWVMAKRTDSTSGWFMWDMMRGMPTDGDSNWVYANTSDAEVASSVAARPNATGFTTYNLAANGTYIYIAIRRPHKPAESGTEVFDPRYGANTANEFFDIGFDADLLFSRDTITASQNNFWGARLTGQSQTSQNLLYSNSTAAEVGTSGRGYFGAKSGGYYYGDARTSLSYALKRSPGFFDVVCYTGTGSSGNVIDHNLGVTPEIIILKRRDTTSNWTVWHSTFTGSEYVQLNNSNALMDDAPTVTFNNVGASSFQIDSTFIGTNVSGGNYIAYLFASQEGISKVGSYTGNGSSQTIDCGFSSGARFVLIKKTSAAGQWHVFDSERGITSTDQDGVLYMNLTDAENTESFYLGSDAIQPNSSGFQLTSNAELNNSGDTYIYLAIA